MPPGILKIEIVVAGAVWRHLGFRNSCPLKTEVSLRSRAARSLAICAAFRRPRNGRTTRFAGADDDLERLGEGSRAAEIRLASPGGALYERWPKISTPKGRRIRWTTRRQLSIGRAIQK